MNNQQEILNIKIEQKIKTIEEYKFEPIKGYPMLYWKGKRPFEATQFYPAQLKENHGEELNGWINKIFWGDNLQVMSHLLKEYRAQINLIYIDPPFDSKADYKKKIQLRGKTLFNDTSTYEEKQYTDIWNNDEYLQFMYERLILMRELLSPNGVIFVHLDPTKVHYIKIIMDQLFGPENFRNEIIWRNTNSHNSATSQFGPIHQNILFYSKTSSFTLHPGKRPFTAGYIRERFKYEDKNGIYQPNYLTGPGLRKGESGEAWRGFNPSSKGRHWAIPKSLKIFLPDEGKGLSTLQLLDALYELDLIMFPKKEGGQPMYKQYLTEGIAYQDIWCYQQNTQGVLYQSEESIDEDVKWLEQEEELNGYPTQKPEGLLRRIIESCSEPGDIVFDCFMGSGTAQAAAMKSGRKFIGADINLGSIQTTTKRLINASKDIKAHLQDKVYFTGFSVYNVNHYDVFRNPAQAKDILIKALEIQPLAGNTLFDGEKDGKMVKIMPINRIATRADLNELINGFDYKMFEKRNEQNPGKAVESVLLICMGHEPDLMASLKKEIPYKLEVEVVDILRDKSNLEFKRDSEAEITVEGNKLHIREFYPMNLLQKLSLMKENVDNWKVLVESVMIDFNYDGAVLEPSIVDVPDENGLVKGIYPIPANAGTIRVKITDLLSELFEITIHG